MQVIGQQQAAADGQGQQGEAPQGIVQQVVSTGWHARWGFHVDTLLFSDGVQRVIVLRHGDVDTSDGEAPPLVRLHSACLTSEALGSTRCDCREQLDRAMTIIGQEGRGMLLYFPDHEGRGIGIEAKLGAYALQDDGHDTSNANVLLGFPVEARDFAIGPAVLRHLGVDSVRLLTNNPVKIAALTDADIGVERVPAWTEASEHAQGYVEHKLAAMDHLP